MRRSITSATARPRRKSTTSGVRRLTFGSSRTIVVEHFRETVAPLLEGRAKAMVVVSSRVEAVRWQLAINKFIQQQGYPLRTLVAFSGEVIDKDSGPDPFKETSSELNPHLKGRDIREAFKGDEYQILLVANKFQTGFDQPLLCGMYVDKRLAGTSSVAKRRTAVPATRIRTVVASIIAGLCLSSQARSPAVPRPEIEAITPHLAFFQRVVAMIRKRLAGFAPTTR